MTERKSTIPPNAQIPVALVLGVCFTALLWRQFAPDGDENARKVVVVSEANYSLEEVRYLIEQVKRDDFLPAGLDTNLAKCEKDPFLWDSLEPIEPVVALAGEPDTSEDDAFEERNERLASLELSGTMFIGRKGIAIINGQQFYAGDEIAGFTVNNIDERTAVLVDDYGAEELEIAFDSLLPLLRGTEAAS
jgi:hypothetical protein